MGGQFATRNECTARTAQPGPARVGGLLAEPGAKPEAPGPSLSPENEPGPHPPGVPRQPTGPPAPVTSESVHISLCQPSRRPPGPAAASVTVTVTVPVRDK